MKYPKKITYSKSQIGNTEIALLNGKEKQTYMHFSLCLPFYFMKYIEHIQAMDHI